MATPEARSRLEVDGAEVSTAWIAPEGSVATLALAHGAGAGMDHPFMAGFARAMGERGVATLRFNFPYLERGKRSPDPERVLLATWTAAFDAGRAAAAGGPVLAGGKSLGGRIASMAVADGMPAAGLVFLGYPLHPPGRPERVRDEHLYRIEAPMVFLHGSADPFANGDLLAKVVKKLGARAELEEVEGGDHSFNVRGRKREAHEVGAGLAELAAPFVRRIAGAG
ncbi:MAG TPA: alpha/beta family hydrolase [Actinomycetota bacterium]|nr:alpha/beta family hydrolase [Actinomycetota bacterium]